MMTTRVILLSDGTGNSASKVWRTNVWRVFESLDLTGSDQVAIYDDGVGTSSFKPLAVLGGAFGWGLKRNVIDLYKFVCRNYRSSNEPSMGSKWLETLREIAPQVEHVGFMLAPEGPANVGFLKAAEAAAPSLKVRLTALGVHSADEIERSVSAFAAEPNCGLIIAPTAVTFMNNKLIVELAARYRLPAIYSIADYPKAGGLISYGLDQVDQFRQGAAYADRILKGAKVAELPVQYPTKFELVVNLKTAKVLGLTISESFLVRVDKVVE
jgi:hypothetical protein